MLLNQGNGTFAAAVSYAAPGSDSIAVADLSGDGKPDLVTTSYTGDTVSVLHNQGNGTFAAAVSYAVGNKAISAAAADLNGDGRLDLAVANYGGDTVSVLLSGCLK